MIHSIVHFKGGGDEREFLISREISILIITFLFALALILSLVFITFFRHTILPLKTLTGSKLSLTTSPASWRFSILLARKNTPH